MNARSEITRIRHILYRFKIKLLYSNKKVKQVIHSVWRVAKAEDGLALVYEQSYPCFDDFKVDGISSEVIRKKFDWENKTYSVQTDRIYRVTGHITIEPKLSLAFLPGQRFITVSKSPAHTHLIPGVLTGLKSKFAGKKRHYPKLIHFDGYAGKNLYHFFDDALNPLMMLHARQPETKALPVLVHAQVFHTKWMQELIQYPPFKDIEWVVQGKDEWITTNELYKAFCTKNWWTETYHFVHAGRPAALPTRRIFLNRKASFQRRLNNNDLIEAVLHKYGFETIYAEDLTYKQQIELFSDTAYFVGIHGAGLTNLLYTNLPACNILEILSEGLQHPHFYWLFELIGVRQYDAILGSDFDINWNFSIDPDLFEQRLRAMLAANNDLSESP